MFIKNIDNANKIFKFLHWEKNAIKSIAFLSKSMYITDSNQYAIELVTYFFSCSILLWSIHTSGKKSFWFNSIFFSVYL